MVKQALIEELLQSLRDIINKLRPLQTLTIDEIASNYVTYWAVLHGLQMAIQCTIDIGSHILAGIGAEKVTDYRGIIVGLGRQRILPDEFVKRFQGIAGFRNILVHQYLDVDVNIVHERLGQGSTDFELFIDYMYEYVQKFQEAGELSHENSEET